MHLSGSCHCGAVRFTLDSAEPVPFQRCYCGICRKVGGGGGYLVNIGGDAKTLEVQGREHVQVYRARIPIDGGGYRESRHERHFCRQCGSHLWAYHPDWPELVHPVAGAIDTPLPVPPATRHMMVGSKARWVVLGAGPQDEWADAYPTTSLADWHRAHGQAAEVGDVSGASDTPVIGLDHLYLSVSDLGRAESYYDEVLAMLGFRKGDKPIAGERHAHYMTPTLQVTLRQAHAFNAHDPYAPGLHHLCLQLPSREAVDVAYGRLQALGIEASPPQVYGAYSPDYYATFFQDPDGIRLELVARREAREQLTSHWSAYTHFLNPHAAWLGEQVGVFHIALESEWTAAQLTGVYSPASLASEGFIHASTRPQVLASANRHFKGDAQLVLLHLDVRRLGEGLVYETPIINEPGRVPEAYPHIYGPLPLEAVLTVHPLRRGDDGEFQWPAELASV